MRRTPAPEHVRIAAGAEPELPVVIGVLADVSGQPDPPLCPFASREFATLTRENFDRTLATARPRIVICIDSPTTTEGSRNDLELRFARLPDFDQHEVAAQLAALRPILPEQERDALVQQVMHTPGFRDLSATWRALHDLVTLTEGPEKIRVKVLPLSKKELYRDLIRASAFAQSILFRKLHDDIYGTAHGEPFAVLLGDYEFGNLPADLDTLERISSVAAAAHCPFIAAAGPSFFSCERFEELSPQRSVASLFQEPDRWSSAPLPVAYAKFRSLRRHPESRYVGLTVPRLPVPVNEHWFAGKPAFAFVTWVANSLARYGWGVGIPAPEPPRDQEFSELGFIPAGMQTSEDETGQPTACPAVFSASSMFDAAQFQAEAPTADLPYTFAGARLAQALKLLLRDRVLPFASLPECETYLNHWLQQYDAYQQDCASPLRPLRGCHVSIVPGIDGDHARLRWTPAVHLPPLPIPLVEMVRIPPACLPVQKP